jgi:hypothetical protein
MINPPRCACLCLKDEPNCPLLGKVEESSSPEQFFYFKHILPNRDEGDRFPVKNMLANSKKNLFANSKKSVRKKKCSYEKCSYKKVFV